MPTTLIDFFGDDFLLVVDESHVTLPQVRAMYNGDRMRKQALVDYGFRLPSALDNRPLKFEEFEGKIKQAMSQVDDRAFDYMEAIISSMTDKERRNPSLIDNSAKRRERIANGSGRSITEVNNLRNSLDQMKRTMKQLKGMKEEDIEKMQRNIQNGNLPQNMQGKVKKGKGKGKGNFHF